MSCHPNIGWDAEYIAAEIEAEEEMSGWVKWTGGLETHNPDGSYTQELTDWLKVNEKCN